MKKQIIRESDIKLTVGADALAAMLDCGRSTAVKIGKDAGAVVRIGKRTLYRVAAVERYLDVISGE